MKKQKLFFRGLSTAFIQLTFVFGLAAIALEGNRTMVDQALGTESNAIVTEEGDEKLYTAYTPDKELLTDGKADDEKVKNAFIKWGRDVSKEGSVLLKNTENGLPLVSEKPLKVTMLGVRSYMDIVSAGAGTPVVENQVIPLRTALREVGKNRIQLNETMENIYKDISTEKNFKHTSGNTAPWAYVANPEGKYDPQEPSLNDLATKNAEYQKSWNEYNDAAIVVFARPSGEGKDFRPGPEGVADGVGSRNALALSKNERELLNAACNGPFKKVVVLIATDCPMEIDEIKRNEKVDSIMYVGKYGCYGSYGVADLLLGDASPSGGLYDTYASHSMSSPAMMNMGHFQYQNTNLRVEGARLPQYFQFLDDNGKVLAERILTAAYGTGATDSGLEKYLIESESIYTGYRYYETRYYDGIVNPNSGAKSAVGIYDSKGGMWNYTDEVSYGFGYGLSYTTFKKTIDQSNVVFNINAAKHSITAKIPVIVENTGKTAAKTSVQIYGQSPYTQYDINNGVEKSAIQLLAFEKSPIIEAGKKTVVTVDVDLQDLASYDTFGAGTYILDYGKYHFAVGNGAHDALNNVLAVQGKTTADGMDYDGVKEAVYTWDYQKIGTKEIDDTTFSVSKSGEKISNQLVGSDWNDYEPGKVKHLTRNDWDGTYPKAYKDMKIPTTILPGAKAEKSMLDHLLGKYIDIKSKANPDPQEKLDAIELGKSGDLKFAHLKGAAYDDPRWKDLLKEIKLEELVPFAFMGGRKFADIPSINFAGGIFVENGPVGIMRYKIKSSEQSKAPWAPDQEGKFVSNVAAQAPLIASTFSHEIPKEQGRLYGNMSILTEIPLIWGTGLNTHRHPYNGRNGEYYCEDPVLSGVMAMEGAIEALNYGCVFAPKHFAFNDQEYGRAGVAPFMTEQRAREIELHAFQIAFEANKYDTPEKNVGMLGTMTSFSKLGAIECTANRGLLTEILRDERGFNGYVVTDLKDDIDLAPQLYVAGITGFDFRDDDIGYYDWDDNVEHYKYDAQVVESLKEIAHRNLYVFAQSNLMNKINTTSHSEWRMTWWRGLYMGGLAVSSILAAASAGAYFFFQLRKKEVK